MGISTNQGQQGWERILQHFWCCSEELLCQNNVSQTRMFFSLWNWKFSVTAEENPTGLPWGPDLDFCEISSCLHCVFICSFLFVLPTQGWHRDVRVWCDGGILPAICAEQESTQEMQGKEVPHLCWTTSQQRKTLHVHCRSLCTFLSLADGDGKGEAHRDVGGHGDDTPGETGHTAAGVASPRTNPTSSRGTPSPVLSDPGSLHRCTESLSPQDTGKQEPTHTGTFMHRKFRPKDRLFCVCFSFFFLQDKKKTG